MIKCSSLQYILKRSKLVKRLAKVLDNPISYVVIYEQLSELFMGYKSNRYEEETIKKMLDLYLEKKGLKDIKSVKGEIQLRQEVREDNVVLIELSEDVEELKRKMINLQELVVKKLEENKLLKNKLMSVKNNHRKVRGRKKLDLVN